MSLDKLSFPLDAIRYAVAGSIVYPPGGRFGPRIQQDIQLVLVYTGEMDVVIDGRLLHVPSGHIALLRPGHEESFTFSKTEETWHRWIAVHVSPLPAASMNALNKLTEYLPLTEDMNRLTDIMLNLQRYSPNDDPAMRSLGLSALHLYPTESLRMLRQREKHPALYRALSWIREHYAEDIALRDLAFQAGLSPEHLVRLFKHHERTTPIQYLWRYRVERAVELLTNTGLNVSEIAHRCGFKTSHHFARIIKQTLGQTASEIRQLSWSGLRQRENRHKNS